MRLGCACCAALFLSGIRTRATRASPRIGSRMSSAHLRRSDGRSGGESVGVVHLRDFRDRGCGSCDVAEAGMRFAEAGLTSSAHHPPTHRLGGQTTPTPNQGQEGASRRRTTGARSPRGRLTIVPSRFGRGAPSGLAASGRAGHQPFGRSGHPRPRGAKLCMFAPQCVFSFLGSARFPRAPQGVSDRAKLRRFA